MRRKVASMVVSAMVITVMSLPVPAGGVAGFGDIDSGKFYTEPVQWMVDNAITTGTSPTCFSPANPVTRGQAAAFMWRMEGFPTGSPAHPFTDVVALWQQDPISWMAAQGITTGTTPTTYSPADPVTRGDLAALLHRLAGSPSAPAPTQFPDVTKPWQITPVGWMLQQGITTGTTPTTFSPDKTVTRGQLATFFYRYKGSPPVVVDPNHPAIPVCETQVPGPSTTGTLTIITNTTLIQNHNGNIVIAADNITLDCAGHTVTGNGTGDGITVDARTGVTVRNCHVSGFVNGIMMGWSVDGQVVGNTTTGNCTKIGWTCAGVQLAMTSGSVVEDNTVTDNVNVSLGGQAFGILLGGTATNPATGNKVSNNLVARNSHDGIHLGSGSDGNTIVGNTATGNLRGGIDLHNGASNNAVTDNIAKDNAWSGFVIIDSVNNTLSGNQAHNNTVGFEIWSDPQSGFSSSSGNTLTGNKAHANQVDGFGVSELSSGNSLSLNEASSNGVFGMRDETSGGTGDAGTDNTYTNNTCTGNSEGNSSPYGLCWG